MMRLKLIVLCCTVLSVFKPKFIEAFSLPFEDCGSIYTVEDIRISQCERHPCRLKIGSTVNVTTNLRVKGSEFDTSKVIQKVYFVVNKINLSAKVTPDPCASVKTELGRRDLTTCPSISGSVIYQATLTVSDLPPLPATLKWTIKDKANVSLICYKLSVILSF